LLGSLPMVIGAMQATRALSVLVGRAPAADLVNLNLWDGAYQSVKVLADEDCPACGKRYFEFLEASG